MHVCYEMFCRLADYIYCEVCCVHTALNDDFISIGVASAAAPPQSRSRQPLKWPVRQEATNEGLCSARLERWNLVPCVVDGRERETFGIASVLGDIPHPT